MGLAAFAELDALEGVNTVWAPHPGPQTALLTCPCFEVFYGGARGGGKTDGMLGEWLNHAETYGADANGLMVRRQRTELVDTIRRSHRIYGQLAGWKWHEQDKTWTSGAGATLRFAYLERDADAEAYQGHSYTRVYVEELGNFRSPDPVLKLMATLRSGAGVPCGFRATGNPGGPGQGWVRARYLDDAPAWTVQEQPFKNPFTGETIIRDRVFIPSSVADNPSVGNDYVANLMMQGSAQLVRAWLSGDWSAIKDAFFTEWDPGKHVVAPFQIPADWLRFRSMDWGSARPFSVGWWAVAGDDHRVGETTIPRGALVRYREWYGCVPGQVNVGMKLTAEEVAAGITNREANDRVAYGVLDPAAFAQDGGPSIAERMQRWRDGALRGPAFRPADNKRVARAGAMGGWDEMRSRLKGDGERPMLFVFSTCRDFIRTVPMLQHDADRPEDLDTDAEDHVADECFVAGTLVETLGGPQPIETLGAGVVLSIDGRYVPFEGARKTRSKSRVVRLTFADGRQVTCTPEHKFLVDRDEWCYASDLLFRSVLCSRPWSARPFKSSMASAITGAVAISRKKGEGFIASSGRKFTALCRAAFTSTMSMATRPTTRSAIWNASRAGSTWAGDMVTLMPSAEREALVELTPQLRFGMVPMPAGYGTPTITSGFCDPSWNDVLNYAARSAAERFRRSSVRREITSTAVLRARRVLCVAVEEMPEPADVYCLTVPSTSAFALAGGMIVHNCRYACMSRPWVAQPRAPTAAQASGYRGQRQTGSSWRMV